MTKEIKLTDEMVRIALKVHAEKGMRGSLEEVIKIINDDLAGWIKPIFWRGRPAELQDDDLVEVRIVSYSLMMESSYSYETKTAKEVVWPGAGHILITNGRIDSRIEAYRVVKDAL